MAAPLGACGSEAEWFDECEKEAWSNAWPTEESVEVLVRGGRAKEAPPGDREEPEIMQRPRRHGGPEWRGEQRA